MKVFKCVARLDDALVSVGYFNSQKYIDIGAVLFYKKKVKVTPIIPNSKLFAFDTLENAINFGYQIWEAEAENVTVPNKSFILDSDPKETDFISFWKNSKKRKHFQDVSIDPFCNTDFEEKPIPKGTVFCDSITLIKLIKA